MTNTKARRGSPKRIGELRVFANSCCYPNQMCQLRRMRKKLSVLVVVINDFSHIKLVLWKEVVYSA